MALTPRFDGPDGVSRERLVLSTTLPQRLLTGRIDSNVVDLQVSIQGAAFSSDPNLVSFSNGRFHVPNPSAAPNGLVLLPGLNNIKVRAVMADGTVTDMAMAIITLVTDRDVGDLLAAPTSIQIDRMDGTVKITIDTIPGAISYNLYASTQAGGGSLGYLRINPDPLAATETSEKVSSVGTLTSDISVVLGTDGQPLTATQPVVLTFQGDQRSMSGKVLQAGFLEHLEAPAGTDHLRVSLSVQSITKITTASFVHARQAGLRSLANPTIPHAEFSALASTEPLFYVATAVHLDNGLEIETEFSAEVSGSPLTVTTAIGTLPTVNHQQVLRDMVAPIFRAQPELSIQPGTFIRDTIIDPVATEIERVRFLVGFLHDAMSFATLQAIDDPQGSGFSVPVGQSRYKTALKEALFLTGDNEVQALIDAAYDKLAANRGTYRLSGRRARGEVLLWVTTRPAAAITIPLGARPTGGGVAFRLTSTAIISASNLATSFDPVSGRWATRAFIQAEETGEAGNLSAGQINSIQNVAAGVKVSNPSRTFWGRGTETNSELALRADKALASVDTGTLQGLSKLASNVPSVRQVSVVAAGTALMQRDLNDNGRHVGGKVDIWVRGSAVVATTETFAFPFALVKGARFTFANDPNKLQLRLSDPIATVANPLVEVLNKAEWGFVLRNEMTGQILDLTGAYIIGPDILQLAALQANLGPFSVTDSFIATVRLRTSDRLEPTRQPIHGIQSIFGERSGALSVLDWDLWRDSDPLALGRSVLSHDHVRFNSTTIPSGLPIAVVGERHVLSGGIEWLSAPGVNQTSIEVTDTANAILFTSPWDPAVALGTKTADYVIIEGAGTFAGFVGIRPTSTSGLIAGISILVNYRHDETFTVEYEHDALIGLVQETIDSSRHATADVLVKQTFAVPIDVSATVVLQQGAVPGSIDGAMVTALARLLDTRSLGQPLRQSDLIGVLETVPGVSYVVVPLTKLARAANVPVVREFLDIGTGSTLQIAAWSSSIANAWFLRTPLVWAVAEDGGPLTVHRDVRMDDTTLLLVARPDEADGEPLRSVPLSAYIIGDKGLAIPGISDDVTIIATFPSVPAPTADQIALRRKDITGNRLVVSLPLGTDPIQHTWAVSYVTGDQTGRVLNIEPSELEYLVLGNLNLTDDTDRLLSR